MFSARIIFFVAVLGACGDDKKPSDGGDTSGEVLPNGRSFLIAARAEAYDALYAAYRELHDYFGQSTKDSLLHRLRRIRNAARS